MLYKIIKIINNFYEFYLRSYESENPCILFASYPLFSASWLILF